MPGRVPIGWNCAQRSIPGVGPLPRPIQELPGLMQYAAWPTPEFGAAVTIDGPS
jgi:hypothetical protein